VRTHGRRINLFCVRQHTLFSNQFFLFVRFKLRLLDLAGLKAPQIHHPQTILLPGLEGIQPLAPQLPATKRLLHLLGRDTGAAVKQQALLGRIKGAQRVTLCVDQGQLRGQGAQRGHRRRLVIDKDARLAASGDFAPQDDLLLCRVDAVLVQNLQGTARALKHAGDHRAVRAPANQVRRRLFTQQQRKCINQNGFAGAGLAGQDVQAGAEGNLRAIDDDVVFGA
jgi:hypothetical protein